jgi:hypothetical protein
LAPTRYRITVRGCLTKPLASAFEGLDMEPGVGQTALVGEIRDQSHLYGVLDLVRALGLDLLSVERTARMTGQILNPLLCLTSWRGRPAFVGHQRATMPRGRYGAGAEARTLRDEACLTRSVGSGPPARTIGPEHCS